MNIGEIQRVSDLAEGERATPEQGTAYGLRSIDNIAVETHVEFVVRRGQRLFARGICGNDFPISGSGALVLTPRSESGRR
jgi:hypothetical protein